MLFLIVVFALWLAMMGLVFGPGLMYGRYR